MKYALLNGKNIEALPDTRAICPNCKKPVISKCGTSNIWHWSHFPEIHCDTWWENESEWHRNWKSQFPSEYQEVILFNESSGEKHIADIRLSNGLVIELQNSPINENELFSREQFYGNMLWVVNGLNFSNQFFVFPFKLPPPNSELASLIEIDREPALNKGIVRFMDACGEESEFQKPILFHKTKSLRVGSSGNYFSGKITANGIYDPTVEVQKEIELVHDGHYFFEWKNKRKVWFKSNKHIYIDFGNENIAQLCAFNSNIFWVRVINKINFINGLKGHA